ncbi:MAG: DNA-processing protein DprA [Balneolaceae bacterium]
MILALKNIPDVGRRKIVRILEAIPPEDLFSPGSEERLMDVKGIGESLAKRIAAFSDWDRIERILDRSRRAGQRMIDMEDKLYPELLRQVADPPPLLWFRGDPSVWTRYCVSVVGTRRPTRYGREQAGYWSMLLARSGLVVVSGLAHGIDRIAHRTALTCNSPTIAVLGSGLDRVYPPEHGKLADEIVQKGGALLSEYSPGTPPHPGHFPDRNRIVTGLSLGLLAVQTGVRGGSMISARLALDQNREVFVVPHRIGERWGEGCNQLIRNGEGKLVQEPADLLMELPPAARPKEIPERLPGRGDHSRSTGQKLAGMPEGVEAGKVCRLLQKGRMPVDRLSRESGLELSRLLPILTRLELAGIVRQRGGNDFELGP